MHDGIESGSSGKCAEPGISNYSHAARTGTSEWDDEDGAISNVGEPDRVVGHIGGSSGKQHYEQSGEYVEQHRHTSGRGRGDGTIANRIRGQRDAIQRDDAIGNAQRGTNARYIHDV